MKTYTVRPSDVGKSAVHNLALYPLGRVQKADVGKRCYLVHGVWQCENEGQRTRRIILAREKREGKK